MVTIVEKMEGILSTPRRVRNMSVIAHVDHGKTTLTDSLLSRAGVIRCDQAGSRCATDSRLDEQLRGITIKSTAVSLHYTVNASEAKWLKSISGGEESMEFLVNLIDCPGHVDFSSEVTAALRVTDGAMVVVDCINGVCVQTETVLRQALSEYVRPVLMMNKMDRSILERQLAPEELYVHLNTIINNVNALVQVFGEEGGDMEDLNLDPRKGNVAFGSGLHGWGFGLRQFARMYASKSGQDEEKLLQRLWGDNFYNPDSRKWSKSRGEGYVRGFNKFILEPIYKMLEVTLANNVSECLDLAQRVGVHIPQQCLDECHALGDSGGGKHLMQAVMRRWLPAGDAMLMMVLEHLPDPVTAQKTRTKALYEGPMDDEVAVAMKECNPEGPLMIYISKMLPSNDSARFFAFGRVFSGTVHSGMNVRIQGPDYVPGEKKDVYVKGITGVKLPTVGGMLSVGAVPCGNIVALSGVDKCLIKSGTITTFQAAHNMKVMRFSVSPVVRVAVDVQQPSDLPKLVKGLKRLEKAEPLAQCLVENGQHIVAGAGELHLEICLQDLEGEFAGIPLKKSTPVVTYRETVSEQSSSPCLAKSGNKHNRLYVTAAPMPEGMAEDIDSGDISVNQDKKERARYLADHYGYDATEMRKIWAFGPEGSGPNILVDVTKGQQNMGDIRDAIVAGYQWATSEGVLCEESMRGVTFNITDAMVHSDPACRKGGQVIPMARRAVMAATLTAKPRMIEPVYLVDVQTCESVMGKVYSVINKRRGQIIEEIPRVGTTLLNMKAYLPVSESFGFTECLRGATGGQAFPQLVFDHWQLLPGDPLEATSLAGGVVQETRLMKGLGANVPNLDVFLDKL